MEQSSSADSVGSHLFQVVGGNQFFSHQLFVLQCAAVAIDLHAAQVGETCLFDERVRQLIDTRRRNTYLCPFACGEHRVFRISAARVRSLALVEFPHGALGGCRLEFKHEAGKNLWLAIAHRQRYKHHLQLSFLPFGDDALFHDG